MNAKERKRLIGAIETYLPMEYREPILRALRLLAAAEGGDGTPETDAELATHKVRMENGGYCYTEPWSGLVTGRFARSLETQRNALAARVAELEKECSAADIYGRTSASHGFINAPKWHELADETKSLYRESAARSKP